MGQDSIALMAFGYVAQSVKCHSCAVHVAIAVGSIVASSVCVAVGLLVLGFDEFADNFFVIRHNKYLHSCSVKTG